MSQVYFDTCDMKNNNKRGFLKLHKVEATSPNAVTLTAKSIWAENNPTTGVLTKSSFMPFLSSLRIEDYDYLERLFELLRDKRRIVPSFKTRTDRGNNNYYWFDFPAPMGNDGVKVLANAELLELVQRYKDGKLFIDFNIDDLIDEGLQTDEI